MAAILVLLIEGFINYAVEMSSDGTLSIQSFLNIGTGVEAILRFCRSDLGGCNVGINEGRIYELCR
jgi:hypothetical protein